MKYHINKIYTKCLFSVSIRRNSQYFVKINSNAAIKLLSYILKITNRQAIIRYNFIIFI